MHVALDVDHIDDLDVGMAEEDVFESLEALFSIGLAGDGEENNISFAVELLRDASAAEPSRFQIIGADKVEPAAGGGIGIDGDHGNACIDGGIDCRLQHRSIGDGNQNAGRLGGNRALQCSQLGLRIIAVRPGDAGRDLILGCSFFETCGCSLPIRQCGVG